ncbi:MAG: ABC transporter substrate-binding protein [Solirubrobacterales bacterium]|nr:ABC transporter substrate-binding protein [Solirubrobacterales bacterium]
MSRATRVLVGGVGVLASLTLAACGGDDEDGGGGAEQLDLVIGVTAPLTGDFSDFGPPGAKAAELAGEQLTETIEEAGLDDTVELIVEDSQSDPVAVVQAARGLVGQGASCLVGAWTSAETIPLGESVALPEQVLMISPGSTSNEVREIDDPDGFVNRTTPPDLFQAPTLASYIAEQLGGAQGRVLNLGVRNDAYGTGFADSFVEAWEKAGGEIGEQVVYDPTQPNYDTEAAQIASGDPDAWVIIEFPDTYAKVGPALARTGSWDPARSFAPDGLASSSVPDDVGREATDGMVGSTVGTPEGSEAGERFFELYEGFAPQDVEPQTYATRAFDATILCYLAAVAAGSTDGAEMAAELIEITNPPGEKLTWLQLDQAVEALQAGEDIDFDGASGPIEMDELGDATGGVYDIWRFKGGEYEVFDETPIVKKVE